MSLAATAGAREGGGGERRRRPWPAHHSLHLISGRCALSKAQASRSRRREGGSCCSHRRHHVLPRQEEHPADHGESRRGSRCHLLPGSLAAHCAAGGAVGPAGFPSRSRGRDGDPLSGGGERRSVQPARLAPHRLSDPGAWGKQNKEETQTVAKRTLDYFSSFPTARSSRGRTGSPWTPFPPGARCACPG